MNLRFRTCIFSLGCGDGLDARYLLLDILTLTLTHLFGVIDVLFGRLGSENIDHICLLRWLDLECLLHLNRWRGCRESSKILNRRHILANHC